MRTSFLLCLLLSLNLSWAWAQELNCNVIVDAKQLVTQQATERVIFDDMQKAIAQFLNDNKWTNDEFEAEERIDCELVITLTNSPSQNVFEATAQIKSSRPIYNTNYQSNLLLYVDRDFNFQYVQGQPLIFNENTFTNNLTSILAFYAYIVIGMDYDSFGAEGGYNFIERAFNIMNIAAQSSQSGWNRNQNTINRYWLAENLMSQQMIPFRQAIYDYHRFGLDRMLIEPDSARKVVFSALKAIDGVNRLKPSAILTNIFFDAKGEEIIKILQESPADTRREAHKILTRLDPARTEKYNRLLQN